VSGGAVVSTAVSARGVGFVYERSGSRTFRSWAPVRGPSWEDATLPAGTTDVTWAPSGALQAFSPRRAVLTVFDETAAHTWDPIQTILVPISIGTPH
jgi:hypothetical protein